MKKIWNIDAIELIVDKAVEYDLGARGLRSICEELMRDAMFEMPSDDKVKSFKLTRAYAEKKLARSKFIKSKSA